MTLLSSLYGGELISDDAYGATWSGVTNVAPSKKSVYDEIETLPNTIIELDDTPAAYDEDKYLKSTVDGTEWATVSGGTGTSNHSELDELDYASAGHTGFASSDDLTTTSGSLQTNIDGKSATGHTHDDRYYTEGEVDTISGTLSSEIDSDIATHTSNSDAHHSESHTVVSHSDTTATGANLNELVGAGDTTLHKHDTLYYTEAEIDTISGSLQTNIDGDKPASEIIVSTINTPTYNDIQDWINNTQSAGRMSGATTTAHTDAITDVTVSGAGSGEFKVAGDQTSCYIAAEPILVEGSTNNDGYYTIASGVVYSGGKTIIPVEEAVGEVADGNVYNGAVDISDGTGFIKQEDSDIAETVSFNIHAETNIILTDVITNYLYVDYNTGTPNIQVTTDRDSIEHNKQFFLSMVYRNGARIWSCSCGVYLPNFLVGNHERLLIARGYERGSGGEISEYGTRNIQSTAGVFFRGSTRVNTTAKTSVDDKLTTVYYDGSDWVWTENETQIDNTYYNNIATGLVELSLNRYAVHWICIDYLSNIYVVYGRGDYTLPEAQLAGVPSLVPVVAYEFGIIAAKIIIQKGASSITELLSAYTQVIPSETPTTHNDLGGLNAGDYKHLTAVNHTDLTDSGDCSIHTHDDRYYTESEVDTISGTLSSEIDSDISTHASNADAHHTESHTVASHSDTTATGANLNELVGAGDTALHKHDGQYYTESEVDTISGSLNTKIDGKDNYTSWSFAVDSVTKDVITSSDVLDFVGGDNITITRSAEDQITISGAAGSGISSIVEDTTPQLGGQLEVGEQDIKYDALLSADGKYSGNTRDGVLGATLAYGDLVYLNTTDQRWELADADAEATSGDVDLAIVLAAGNDGETKLLLTDGYVREDDWDFTSYGQALYVSTTAGDMTQDVSAYTTGDIVRVIGKAGTTADQIYFNPDGLWLELTATGTLGTTIHSELSNLDYASAGHTGFSPDSHSHSTISNSLNITGSLDVSSSAEIGTSLDVGSSLDVGGATSIDGNITLNAKTIFNDQVRLNENDFKLDALLSADGKYSGTTRDGIIGDTLAFGDLVYLNTTDQRWELADADAEITSGDVDLAIVLAAGVDGETKLLLMDGFVREDDWNFTSYGQALFVSTTSGTMTQTAPVDSGDIVRVVGKAGTTANEIRFKPSETWIELS